MALSATIYRATLTIADIDRGYYNEHRLTVACHPSETAERMMMRMLAFSMLASDELSWGRGLSTDDEPDIWEHDLSGQILRWVDVGLPDERRLRRACGRAAHVVVLSYGGAKAEVWWRKNGKQLAELGSLSVVQIAPEASTALAQMVARTMQLSVTVQDGALLVSNGASAVEIHPLVLHRGPLADGDAR